MPPTPPPPPKPPTKEVREALLLWGEVPKAGEPVAVQVEKGANHVAHGVGFFEPLLRLVIR